MSSKILTLIPVKPNLHSKLRRIIRNIAAQLTAQNTNLQVILDDRGTGDAQVKTLEERVAHTCGIRNGMVEEYLRPDDTHVFWVDADIIGLDPTLPNDLLARAETSHSCVVAPKVMVYDHKGRKRFYDTAGFITLEGKWTRPLAPYGYEKYGMAESSLIPMNGVGCVYMVPAEVYRAGARHEPRPGFTDHLAVCEFARGMGYRVALDTSREVFHAWLPHYGEACH